MDLILQAYATDSLDGMDDAALTLYDDFLDESDHDLYQWVTGQFASKPPFEALVRDIQAHIERG
jgi:antitoxin CptB